MNDPRLTPTGKGCLNPTYVTQAPITIDNTPARLDPADLRTVPMPDLRTPDAEARDLRTAGDKLAELTQDMRRLSETVQLMAVPLDVAMRLDDLAARVDMLAARVDMLAARPLAMAEDAWGVG